MQSNLDELERTLGYSFTNRPLLARAVTHSSSVNEAQPAGVQPEEAPADNERLEFLGDAVLGFFMSQLLFHRYRNFDEGRLSLLKNHLVSATHLLTVAAKLELGRYLQLGRGEETAGGRTKRRLLVNAFEAVVAAIYLDGGLDAAHAFLLRHAMPPGEELDALAGSGPPHDFRAELERLARERKLPRPVYSPAGENGPGHARIFIVEVHVGTELFAAAEGPSRKSAAHNAARGICEILRG